MVQKRRHHPKLEETAANVERISVDEEQRVNEDPRSQSVTSTLMHVELGEYLSNSM